MIYLVFAHNSEFADINNNIWHFSEKIYETPLVQKRRDEKTTK